MDESTRRVLAAKDAVLDLIPSPWNRDRFLTELGALRGRPIELMPVASTPLTGLLGAGRGTPCGLWLECAAADVIAFDAGTTDYHVDQIIAHEAGHMLLDHGADTSGLEGLQELLPDIDPATIRRVLGRSQFGDHQEDEAEMFADLLLSSTSRYRTSRPMRSFWREL
ncbi:MULTISPECIES: hypothetical protein [unclassified Nocardia]|uniref:hypothetical protein n=1 Tax=unclassified Nocardia TaxID=2637762 RepID=UPI001CE4A042|nr:MULTISPECIES: hypothetical protein [unclassified Nocardia]